MKDNIYIKALEIGFRNETTGISFDEVVKELGIEEDLKNIPFKVNFILWFYNHFYCCSEVETKVLNSRTGQVATDAYRVSENSLKFLDQYSSRKAFIRGESIQKYIDYLELKEARESAQSARVSAQKAINLSIGSVIIALIAIITPILISRYAPEPPQQVIIKGIEDAAKDDKVYKELIKLEKSVDNAILEFKQTKKATKSEKANVSIN